MNSKQATSRLSHERTRQGGGGDCDEVSVRSSGLPGAPSPQAVRLVFFAARWPRHLRDVRLAAWLGALHKAPALFVRFGKSAELRGAAPCVRPCGEQD